MCAALEPDLLPSRVADVSLLWKEGLAVHHTVRLETWPCTSLILAALISLPGTASADKQEAMGRFDKGVELSKLGDYEGALTEFRAAYEAEPHFRVRYNIGICLYKMGRYVEALTELTAYLSEGGDEIPQDRKQEVDSILQEITSYIGQLNVTCNVDGAWILVDGKPVGETPLPAALDIDVGEHVVELKKKGFEPVKVTISVPGGKTVNVEAALEMAGGLSAQDRKNLFKARATPLFIAGEVVSGVGLLGVPAASLAYFAGDDALETYVVPSVGLVALAGTTVLAFSHMKASRNLVAFGVDDKKRIKSIRIAAWIFLGTTYIAEGGFWLMNGLFNVHDHKLSGCSAGECDSIRSTRRGFMIVTYLMMGALVGSVALTMGLSTAAWVLIGKSIKREVLMEQDGEEAPPPGSPEAFLVPTVTPIPGGAVLGLSGAF